ncbi:MAG: DUF5908 family protein [Bacteroidota bacterium]
MPIEIKELIVRTTIETDANSPAGPTAPAPDPSAIVAECVEQVLEILKQQKER